MGRASAPPFKRAGIFSHLRKIKTRVTLNRPRTKRAHVQLARRAYHLCTDGERDARGPIGSDGGFHDYNNLGLSQSRFHIVTRARATPVCPSSDPSPRARRRVGAELRPPGARRASGVGRTTTSRAESGAGSGGGGAGGGEGALGWSLGAACARGTYFLLMMMSKRSNFKNPPKISR